MTQSSLKSDFALAVLIGVASGMRTTAPIVAMAENPQRAWYALFGEFCVDKLPFTPARTNAGGMFGRVGSSIWAGLELARTRNSSFVQAALVAGVTSVVATNFFYELRRGIVKNLRVPDTLFALAEDACVARLITHIRTARYASVCR